MLIFGVTKIVSEKKILAANSPHELLLTVFAEAYEELRRACPKGDLIIHLSVEAHSAEEVGATLEPLEQKSERPTLRINPRGIDVD